jgi:uncharacterized protein (DUF305 family)
VRALAEITNKEYEQMSFRFRGRTAVLLATALVAPPLVAGCGGSSSSESPASSSSGSSQPATKGNAADRAFVRQMVPHHQMAVQMAQVAKRESRRDRVTKVASDIIAAQTSEISDLQRIARQLGVKPAPMMTGGGHMDHAGGEMMDDARALGLSMDEMGMSMDTDSLEENRPFDRAFIDAMIPHHQGAIQMARAELAKGVNPELRRIARDVVAAQAKEISEMNSWRRQWYGAASPAGGVPAA